MKTLRCLRRGLVSTTLFRLAIANILSNLMVPLAGLVDVAFLGHLDGLHHLLSRCITLGRHL